MRITISSALTPLVLSALTAAFAQPIRTAGPQEPTPLQESMETLNQGEGRRGSSHNGGLFRVYAESYLVDTRGYPCGNRVIGGQSNP